MRRALILGSQIDGLRGVENDTRLMEKMLRDRKFEVDVRTGSAATRDGILAGYDALIEASSEGDAAVVYYSGHGFYATEQGRLFQCIAPTDLHSGADGWRGISSWELSIKQADLTAKTRNVTVILDCCHSAQMSRDSAIRSAVPRALPHPVTMGFDAHLAALRLRYPHAQLDAIGNQDAVRLVACGQDESAFEYRNSTGEFGGAFTEALLDIFREIGDAEISWNAISDALRARVQRNFVTQRPDAEGPTRRRMFSLTMDDERGIVPISVVAGAIQLPVGQLTGATLGDVYSVMPVGSSAHDKLKALTTVELIEISPLHSIAKASDDKPIPIDAIAIPITKAVVRRGVKLRVPNDADRAQIAQAISTWPTLRVADDNEADAVATLKLDADKLTIEDDRGPLFPEAKLPDDLAGTVRNLANLGVAQAVRELEGEHGVYTNELDIELGLVVRGEQQSLPNHGSALGLRDRIYVKVTNRSHRQLFLHVFNVGVRGKVTLITNFSPSGVASASGGPAFVLGQGADGVLKGLGLSWPKGLPRDSFPRLDELFVFATTKQLDLRSLETREFIAATRGPSGALQSMLAQLHDGLTRDTGDDTTIEGFSVKRLSYLLHPRDAAFGGVAFEIDENPLGQVAARDPGAWITRGDSAPKESTTDAPDAIAIRIADLIVNKNRAVFSADIRVDAVICTRSAGTGHATWTQKYSGIKDGERLALENGLLFLGPVRDFVDITLFVSRDTEGSVALAKLFAERANSPEFKDAATALLVTAGAVAAPWVTAVGASAVLARIAYELVLGVANKSIGLYRTSFLRREQFGVGRHPAESLYRAQDFSFAIVIEPVELQ